jgi:NADH:ubiquinone oxidoreductase subunit C
VPEELRFDCAPEDLVTTMEALRGTELAGQHGFCDACGVEREETIEVIYRFYLIDRPIQVVLRTQVPKNKPSLPTLSGLYKGCLWAEREAAEMFGLTFEGHPDPRHLLLPDDWTGFPLRKDYVYPLDHPWMAPDPLRDDPAKALCPAEGQLGEETDEEG